MDRRTGPAAATVWAEALESSQALGRVAGRLRAPLADALRGGVREALQGRAAGHALHPVAVQFPIGLLTSAIVLDMWGRGESWRESRRLVAVACASTLPAVLTGWAEWLDADERTQRVGVAHAAVNAGSAVALFGSLAARSGRRPASSASGMALSVVAALGFGVAGYLGGHMSLVRKYATHDAPSDLEGARHGQAGHDSRG